MPVDVEKVIAETGLTGEDAERFKAMTAANPKLAEGFLRQSEFSRQMNDLTPAQQRVKDREAELDAQAEALAKWKVGQEGELTATREALANHEREVLETRQAAEKALRDAGLEPGEHLKVTPKTTRVEPKQPVVGAPNGASREDVGLMGLNAISAAAQLQKLSAEHAKLFPGNEFDPEELVQQTADEAKKGNPNATLRGTWERLNKVPERRVELTNADIERRIKAAKDEGFAEAKTQMALGNGRPGEPTEGVLALSKNRQQQQGRTSAVDRAVAAWEKSRKPAGT